MEMISLFLVTVVCKICLLTFFYTIQTSGSKPLNKLPNQKLNFSKSKIALKTEKALLRTSNLPLKSYFSCMVGSKPEKVNIPKKLLFFRLIPGTQKSKFWFLIRHYLSSLYILHTTVYIFFVNLAYHFNSLSLKQNYLFKINYNIHLKKYIRKSAKYNILNFYTVQQQINQLKYRDKSTHLEPDHVQMTEANCGIEVRNLGKIMYTQKLNMVAIHFSHL